MSSNIKRHFVTLDGRWGIRQVHYRRAGAGPLLLMLHQSPQSSRELEPVMQEWSADFTVIAPDSPGYGLSDPLGVATAELSEFAAATVEFLDAIGARRFGVYGFHTGGMIGVAIAHGFPDRVAGFACNGIAVLTAAERKDILANYLPPFEPRWDGGHLAWLWGRSREQTIFFPWHNRSLASRMSYPMPSAQQLQTGVCEFLRASDHYHVGYRAAFTFDSQRVVAELKVPGLITATSLDPLQSHLERLENCPPSVALEPIETIEAATASCLQLLRQNPGDELSPAPDTRPAKDRLWRQIIQTDTDPDSIAVLQGGEPGGQPVILVHGAGGSGATVAALAAGLAEKRPVIAIDLPGHGETDPGSGAVSIRRCADIVVAVMAKLGITKADIAGFAGGACVAAEFATGAPEKTGRLALIDPLVVSADTADDWRENGLPTFAAHWSGGHLLACWLMVRDSRLFFPWFRREPTGIRWQEPDLDDRNIQLEVTEFLKAEGSWQALLAEQLEYPLLKSLQACADQVCICGTASSPWYNAAETLAGQCRLPFHDLGDDARNAGQKIAAVLAG